MNKIEDYKLLHIKKKFNNVGALDSCTFEFETKARSKKNKIVSMNYDANNPELSVLLDQCIANNTNEAINLNNKLEDARTGKIAKKHENIKKATKILITTAGVILFISGITVIGLPIWGGPLTLAVLPAGAALFAPALARKITKNPKFMQKSFAEQSCENKIFENESVRKELENIKNYLVGNAKIDKGIIENLKDVRRRYVLQKPRTKEEYETLRKFYSDYSKHVIIAGLREYQQQKDELDRLYFDDIAKMNLPKNLSPSAKDRFWLSNFKVTYVTDNLRDYLFSKASILNEKYEEKGDPKVRKESLMFYNRARYTNYEGVEAAMKTYAKLQARIEKLKRKNGKIIGYIEANEQKFGKTR